MTENADGTLSIDWADVADADSYVVLYLSGPPNVGWLTFSPTTPTVQGVTASFSGSSVTLSGSLSPMSGTYFAQVRAVNQHGNSRWSPIGDTS